MFPLRFSFYNPPEEKMGDSIYRQIVFDGESNTLEPEPPIPANTRGAPRFLDTYRQLLNDSMGPSMSAYRKFLDQGPPRREDYKPSIPGRLGAILSGVAASWSNNPGAAGEVVHRSLNRPYEEAANRWNLEGSAMREAANVEAVSGRDRLNTVKVLSEIENKERDDERAEAIAKSLIAARGLNMERTRQLMADAGLKFVIKEDGTGGYTRANGTFQPIGKFNLSTGEKITNEQEMKRFQEDLDRESARILEDQRFGHRKTLQDDAQLHSENMQEDRQKDMIERQRERLGYGRSTGSARDDSINQTILRNRTQVEAKIRENPEKYGHLWKVDQRGYMNLDTSFVGTPEYEELRKILDANLERKTEPKKVEKKAGAFTFERSSER